MIKTAVFVKCACVIGLSTLAVTSAVVSAKNVSDSIVAEQREALDKNTQGKGFGPQSPRDIDQNYGTNLRSFGMAPSRSELNLCNIHFHKNAEHKGGEFTTYAGNGDGKGHHTGYLSERKLSAAQLQPVKSVHQVMTYMQWNYAQNVIKTTRALNIQLVLSVCQKNNK